MDKSFFLFFHDTFVIDFFDASYVYVLKLLVILTLEVRMQSFLYIFLKLYVWEECEKTYTMSRLC